MAGLVAEPNEESMEYAQASGSMTVVTSNRMNVQQRVKEVISEQRYVKSPHVDTFIVLCFDYEDM